MFSLLCYGRVKLNLFFVGLFILFTSARKRIIIYIGCCCLILDILDILDILEFLDILDILNILNISNILDI
jgi:hypothetical protein